jgi:ribosome biogenesis protein BMS1
MNRTLQSLVKKYTRYNLTDVKGPITIVTGKDRRVTFYECNNDLNSMTVRRVRTLS